MKQELISESLDSFFKDTLSPPKLYVVSKINEQILYWNMFYYITETATYGGSTLVGYFLRI